MRKFKVILIIILLFFLIYFMQANFFAWFNIGGIMPNLFVLLVLFIGLFVGNKIGAIFGILFGMILDIVIGRIVGPSSVLLGIVGMLGEYFDKNFSKDSKITLLLMEACSLLIYEIGMYAFRIIQYGIEIEILTFTLTLIVEIVFNILFTIIFYPAIKKLGYYMEESFKGKKILTRYF